MHAPCRLILTTPHAQHNPHNAGPRRTHAVTPLQQHTHAATAAHTRHNSTHMLQQQQTPAAATARTCRHNSTHLPSQQHTHMPHQQHTHTHTRARDSTHTHAATTAHSQAETQHTLAATTPHTRRATARTCQNNSTHPPQPHTRRATAHTYMPATAATLHLGGTLCGQHTGACRLQHLGNTTPRGQGLLPRCRQMLL
jgi:hypothetical protein